MSRVLKADLKIPSGGSASNFHQVEGGVPVAIYCAEDLTGANYSFLTQHEETDADDIAVPGITIAHSDGAFVPLTAEQYTQLLGCKRIAIVSDGTELADRVVRVIFRELVK